MNATSVTLLLTLALNCHQSGGETLPPPLLDAAPLIRALGGGAYRERTDATRKLQSLGESVRPQLQKAALGEDLEISRRAGMLLHALDQDRRRRAMALIDDNFASLPWLDMAFIQPPDQCARERFWPYYEAACNAREARDGCPAEWGRYRQATRLLCYDMAEAGVPLWVIRTLVAELEAREEGWVKNWKGAK